jgi:DNA polymerase-3 subunit gamma/tau
MRDALSIMDQAIASAPVGPDGRPHLEAAQIRELMGSVPNTVFERLLESVSENNSAGVMTEIDTLLNAGNSPSQLARQMVRYLRNALMAKLGGESTELLQISADERARAARTSMLFAEEDLTRFLQIMLRTFDEMNYRQEPRFHLELGLLKLVHTQRLIPLEQLMSQLPSGVGGASRPGATAKPSAANIPQRSAAASAPPGRPAAPSPAPAPPRSVASNEAARGGSAGDSGSPSSPSFSPFQSDTRRKSGPTGMTAVGAPESVRDVTVHIGTLQPVETAIAVALEPEPASVKVSSPAVAAAVEVVPASSDSPALRQEPPEPEVRGHLSSETERIVADLDEEIASDGRPETPATEAAYAASTADPTVIAREAVTLALHDKGHETASALLRAGQWSLNGDTITVAVAVRKTMLSLTMNPEAERISRNALQAEGIGAKLVVVPGDGSVSLSSAAPMVANGSIQSQALENPLVKQAQELFRAEVRSILDLRGKK